MKKILCIIWCSVFFVLFTLFVLSIIDYNTVCDTVKNTPRTELINSEYYEQAENNIKCETTNKQAICTKVVDELDTGTYDITNTTYSFTIDDVNFIDELYYDSNTEYSEDDTYNCTVYRFVCKVNQINYAIARASEYYVVVLGNGDASDTGQIFTLDRISSECVEKYASEIIENALYDKAAKSATIVGCVKIVWILLGLVIIEVSSIHENYLLNKKSEKTRLLVDE